MQPGLVLKAAFVELFVIEEMETTKMMLIRGKIEDAVIAGLGDRKGNFKDDAGGVVGRRPDAPVSRGAVYLAFLVRCRVNVVNVV
eukprot:COSAG05_NODE_1249_length_5388_cov_42.102477_3_plen_85_part_00